MKALVFRTVVSITDKFYFYDVCSQNRAQKHTDAHKKAQNSSCSFCRITLPGANARWKWTLFAVKMHGRGLK